MYTAVSDWPGDYPDIGPKIYMYRPSELVPVFYNTLVRTCLAPALFTYRPISRAGAIFAPAGAPAPTITSGAPFGKAEALQEGGLSPAGPAVHRALLDHTSTRVVSHETDAYIATASV